jgi:dTDP-4-dehydrorhamnose reductase
MARIACIISGIDFSLPNWDQKIYHAIEEKHLATGSSCNSSITDEQGMFFDVIIHLAAFSSPTKCQDDPQMTMQVNCPTQLLSMSPIIIYMSTDQVYEGNQSYYIEEDDNNNNIPVYPINVYGQSKAKFETHLLHSKQHAGSIILRCSLVLGPSPPLKHGCSKSKDCPTFIQFVESRLTSHTSTDYYIDEYRSVVHINDVILTIRHFLNIALLNNTPETTNKVTTQVYNLGGSTRVSRYDIATAVANYLQLDTSSINAVNRPIIGGGGGGTVPSPADISMNVSKLTNELGVERMLCLDEIVALTYKKNNDALY